MKLKKIMIWTLGTTAVLLLLSAGFLGHYFGFILVDLDTEPPVIGAEIQRPAILVFSKANGFVHEEALPAGKNLFAELAGRNGWQVYQTDNGAVMNAEQLARFNVVVWNNVSGTVLTERQQQAFTDYLHHGGGYLGVHASGGDFYYSWDWYVNDLLGAQFIGHTMSPQFQDAVVNPAAPVTALTAHLPAQWRIAQEEWYGFDRNPRAIGADILLVLDETSYDPNAAGMVDEHPIAWRMDMGQGRMVYSGIGHTAASYELPDYQIFLEQALRWAGRLDQ